MNRALVAFPLLATVRLNSRLELACLALLLMLSLIGKPLPGDRAARYVPMALLVGVCAGLSLLRGAPRIEQIAMAATAASVILAARRCTAKVAVASLVAGISVYLWANIAGWAIGIQSPGALVRVGLTEGRVIFPFTRSINEPAIAAAALLAFIVISWRKKLPVSRLAWAGIPAAVAVILLSGSRFPIIVTLALVVPAVLIPRTARLVPALALASMSLAFVFTWITPVVNWAAQLIATSFLDRDHQSIDEISSGSSRAGFWRIGLAFWDRVPDLSKQFFGFGFNGHAQSGVVYLYYHPGGFVNDPVALTLHSTFLQQMYDTGYIGLTALVVALAIIGLRFSRAGDLPTSAMIGVLYATSAIEVFMVPSFRAIPFLLVLALSVVIPSPSSSAPSESAEPRRKLSRRPATRA